MAQALLFARRHGEGMPVLSIVRFVHIAMGVVAFLVLPVPLFAKKGSRRHVAFGRIYVWAMAALALTGVPLAARGLFFHDAAHRANALFLFFIALLASDSAWRGVRALRIGRNSSAGRSAFDLVPPSLLLAASIGLGGLGLARGVVLHVFFALLGSSLALGQLWSARRVAPTRTDSIVEHIGGMGVSAITTVTAFLVTNARHVFHLGTYNVFVWITPAVVGAIAIGVAQRAWRARLTRPAT
jgi:uncharacterized membrane protein